MNITVIGSGYVGLVTGVCLADFGHQVICVENNNEKLEMLKKGLSPIYEPDLERMMQKNMQLNRLRFTNMVGEAVQESSVIFLAVGTPSLFDGTADLSFIESATQSIGEHMNDYCVIVNKSTVPVGTAKRVREIIGVELERREKNISFDVVSNPEFLREGKAVYDFFHPDRIVIGADAEQAFDVMRNVYRVLYLNNHPFLYTSLEAAELIKYASNAFLATKIAFINEVARLCDAVGANVQDVARGMGMDNRIGKYFLHAGPGYGGSCFPKDTRALVAQGKEVGVEMTIVDTVICSNVMQHDYAVEKIASHFDDMSSVTFGVLGLAFKGGTDDIRESPAVYIIRALLKMGAVIQVYDPKAMEMAKQIFCGEANLEFVDNPYDVSKNADALVVLTEWNDFRGLDFGIMSSTMRGRLLFDMRNLYEAQAIMSQGLRYIGIGK